MNRRNPFYMDTLKEALQYSRKHWKSIWTLIKGQPGVFRVFPGGRIEHRNFKHLGRSI